MVDVVLLRRCRHCRNCYCSSGTIGAVVKSPLWSASSSSSSSFVVVGVVVVVVCCRLCNITVVLRLMLV